MLRLAKKSCSHANFDKLIIQYSKFLNERLPFPEKLQTFSQLLSNVSSESSLRKYVLSRATELATDSSISDQICSQENLLQQLKTLASYSTNEESGEGLLLKLSMVQLSHEKLTEIEERQISNFVRAMGTSYITQHPNIARRWLDCLAENSFHQLQVHMAEVWGTAVREQIKDGSTEFVLLSLELLGENVAAATILNYPLDETITYLLDNLKNLSTSTLLRAALALRVSGYNFSQENEISKRLLNDIVEIQNPLLSLAIIRFLSEIDNKGTEEAVMSIILNLAYVPHLPPENTLDILDLILKHASQEQQVAKQLWKRFCSENNPATLPFPLALQSYFLLLHMEESESLPYFDEIEKIIAQEKVLKLISTSALIFICKKKSHGESNSDFVCDLLLKELKDREDASQDEKTKVSTLLSKKNK